MDHLNDHRKILERAAASKLPARIDGDSRVSLTAFRELYEQGLVDGADASDKDGDEFLEPRITLRGREYLNELERRAFDASTVGRLKRAATLFGGWLAGIATAVLADLIGDKLA